MIDIVKSLRRIAEEGYRFAGDAADEIERLRSRLEAAEKSDAESMAMYRRVRGERDALRAKVEAMEKQLPVKYEFQGRDGKWYPFIDQRHYENTVADGTWPIRSLYALPGAQNVPSVPACADIMDAARYRSEWVREQEQTAPEAKP